MLRFLGNLDGQNIQMSHHTFIYHHEATPIHFVLCQYVVKNQSLSGAKKQQNPLLIDSFIASSLLKDCGLRKAGSGEHQLPPLQAVCDVYSSHVISMRENPDSYRK